ncbi:MAG: hypothetical protein IPL28_13215 [Chloroflexi bacterium]|nr:hypothetical protein [Chloroflexota bacterium]
MVEEIPGNRRFKKQVVASYGWSFTNVLNQPVLATTIKWWVEQSDEQGLDRAPFNNLKNESNCASCKLSCR